MLSAGKAQGIVKIEIRNPDNLLYGQVERELEKVFDLQEVIIVPSSALPDNKVANNPELGRAALKFMTRILRDGDYVGLSMGSALQSTARADFFDVHSNYLAQEFEERFGGECVQFFAPALFSKESVLADFLKEKTIRRVAALYQKLDVLIMGIGAVVSEHSTVLCTPATSTKRPWKMTPFADFNNRVAGINLKHIKSIPCRVGIAGGGHKIKAVTRSRRLIYFKAEQMYKFL